MMAEYSYDQFLAVHEPQLLTSAVPEQYWKQLYQKLKNADFDAGECFQIIVEQDEDGLTQTYSVTALKDILIQDPNNIFLIDHAWTFNLNSARSALREVKGLKERLMECFGIRLEDLDDETGSDYIGSEAGDIKPHHSSEKKADEDYDSDHSSGSSSTAEIDEKLINALLDKLPQFMETYTIKVRKNVIDEHDTPVWFLNDEFGLKISHSITPNVSMIPFYYISEKEHAAYSILFPTKDVSTGEEITRNYINNLLFKSHPNWQDILLFPRLNQDLDLKSQPIKLSHKDDAYFLDGRIPDQIDGIKSSPVVDSIGILDTVKIYATDTQLLEYLNSVKFERVNDLYEADVIWTREHFHDFSSLAQRAPNTLINQFPYESALTVKDLFAACVQTCPEFENSFDETRLTWKWPGFFPATFNLNEELPAFVTYFQKREQLNLDNSFIIKPYNLARGLDTTVTSNLKYVIRVAETGPKLACKYIQNPILFRRPDTGRLVKFDLRYIVLVRSFDPLDVYVYKDFWPRCAINNFDLKTLDDTLAHLSVFNYSEKEKVLNIRPEEFISHLQKLHPKIKWPQVQDKIDKVIVEVLKIASTHKEPRGIVQNAQSRGMYGLDIMISWKDEKQEDVEVFFLEANFIPDCKRACEFYPDFADTVFQTLFLGGGSERVRQIS